MKSWTHFSFALLAGVFSISLAQPVADVIGHSYGALIAQLVAGAKLDDAEDGPLLDNLPRPAAVVAISPPGPVPGSISAMGWSEIEIPMLVTTGTTDILPGFIDDWRGHLTSYEAAQAQETYALIYEDMDHYMDGAYGRETNLSGEALASRKAAIDHLVGAIALFADQISMQSAPSAERWKALAGPSLEVLTKMDE